MPTRPTKSPAFGIGFALIFVILPLAAQPDQKTPQDNGGIAVIHGSITVSTSDESIRQQQARNALQGRYQHHMSGDKGPGEASQGQKWSLSEQIVLYLEGASIDHQQYPAPEKHPVLNQMHLAFHPRVLPVLTGTTVDFPNRDNLFHNVFSYSRAKEFDLGRYPMNDSRSVTFDEPGIVRVYCDIHSRMNATILVLPNPYFTVPSDDGNYTIRHVPAGKYTLVVWYGRDVVERRPVVLKDGETLEVNIAV
jgi:plastocyanin